MQSMMSTDIVECISICVILLYWFFLLFHVSLNFALESGPPLPTQCRLFGRRATFARRRPNFGLMWFLQNRPNSGQHFVQNRSNTSQLGPCFDRCGLASVEIAPDLGERCPNRPNLSRFRSMPVGSHGRTASNVLIQRFRGDTTDAQRHGQQTALQHVDTAAIACAA